LRRENLRNSSFLIAGKNNKWRSLLPSQWPGEMLNEKGCTGRTDKMTGIVKKIDAQGFGIIDGADGSKVPFIPSDVMNRHVLEQGQKVIFSVRRVKEPAFAEHVTMMRERRCDGAS
jgi:cold shock CspA family protein